MGVKHGILPLHVWLPPAHGIAPSPASALLSGALLKTGVLGWMRFLPLAGPVLAELAPAIALLGLAAAFYGALLGCLQQTPKMLLAYSSISQMGILTAAFAPAAAAPERWSSVLPVIVLLALHHAMVKASLFLGVGADRSGPLGRLVYPALLLASLALMGLPPFGGFLGKMWMDPLAAYLPQPTMALFEVLLPLTSTATTVLMGRFLWLARTPTERHRNGPATGAASPVAALLLLALGLSMPAVMTLLVRPDSELWLDGGHLWKAAWPILLGAAVVACGAWGSRRGWRLPLSVPPGDVVVPLERLAAALRAGVAACQPRPRLPVRREPLSLADAESLLRRMSVTGAVYLALLVLLGWAADY